MVQRVKTRTLPQWKRTLESALGGSSAGPHPGKDLNNVMNVLNPPTTTPSSLPEPESGTRRRIYLKGEKEVDITLFLWTKTLPTKIVSVTSQCLMIYKKSFGTVTPSRLVGS